MLPKLAEKLHEAAGQAVTTEELAAAFAQASLLAVQRRAVLAPMRLRASSPDQSGSKLPHSRTRDRQPA